MVGWHLMQMSQVRIRTADRDGGDRLASRSAARGAVRTHGRRREPGRALSSAHARRVSVLVALRVTLVVVGLTEAATRARRIDRQLAEAGWGSAATAIDFEAEYRVR